MNTTRNNRNKKRKTHRVSRTLPTLAALTAAYYAMQTPTKNPFPETTAFCAIPEGKMNYRCNYSLNGKTNNPLWIPTVHGHSYTLKGTPGVDPTSVDNVGCPTDMTSSNRNRCRQNWKTNLRSYYSRAESNFPIASTPHEFAPGFRFPTYNEMVEIKKVDPTAPEPTASSTYWQEFLSTCVQNPKECAALGLVLSLFVGSAVHSNVSERKREVAEKTLRMKEKIRNNQRKFNKAKFTLSKGSVKRGGTRKN